MLLPLPTKPKVTPVCAIVCELQGVTSCAKHRIAILKHAEGGIEDGRVCRQHGVAQTLLRSTAKYGGVEMSDASRNLKQLADEHGSLKHVGAELTLDTDR